eukprot:8667334-Pyramimonas_sp.AAC.1
MLLFLTFRGMRLSRVGRWLADSSGGRITGGRPCLRRGPIYIATGASFAVIRSMVGVLLFSGI